MQEDAVMAGGDAGKGDGRAGEQALSAARGGAGTAGRDGARRWQTPALLTLASFAALFWEVLLIRWLPAELPLLGYFRSVVLLASFLGMGLGFIVYGRARWGNAALVNCFLAGVCVLFGVVALGGESLRHRGFGRASGILEQTADETPGIPEFTLEFEGTDPGGPWVVAGAFLYVTVLFVPLGVLMARYFDRMAPVRAYSLNVLGSLAGTLAFMGLSLGSVGPPVWVAIGCGSLLALLAERGPRSGAARWAACGWSALALLAAAWLSRGGNILWSPYQRVSWRLQKAEGASEEGRRREVVVRGAIFVNHEYHQQILNCALFPDRARLVEYFQAMDEAAKLGVDTMTGLLLRYEAPYAVCRPRSVLIVAAGNGNEAAAALRHGAQEIDAVEIDPGIIEVGRRHHPERPYSSPRVRVVCDDARGFLQRTDKTYDLVVMNAVDSHSQFATSAGLRLDSYIFTLEFFEQVRRHMKPDGLFALEFSGYHWKRVPWARERLAEILWRVFGFRPTEENTVVGAGGPLFFIRLRDRPGPETYRGAIRVATDDWPQFYLRDRFIPGAYVRLMLAVALVSSAGLLAARPKGMVRFDAHFFFLGAAFMLLEIKSISELSLVFGMTWLVSSMVIAAILAAIGVANVVVLGRGSVPYAVGYAIVLLSLAAGVVLGPEKFLGWGLTARAVAACLRVAAPVFGAGLVFASSFRRARVPPAALGWNLLGAMVGGLGEYLSLITGVRALGFYILALYVVSWLALRFARLRAA